MEVQDINLETWQVILLLVAVVWEMVWKGYGLWRAARNEQSGWYIAMLVFNTVGLLPIIYLLISRDHAKSQV